MTLDRRFEKFRGGPKAPSAEEVRVTINRKGDLYLNAKAYHVFGRPKAVALYYSREDDAIAVEPAYPRFAENFAVVKCQAGWKVHASSFCRHYNIRIPNTERFLRPDLTDDGQLILNLRDTITVGGIVRTASGSDRVPAHRKSRERVSVPSQNQDRSEEEPGRYHFWF